MKLQKYFWNVNAKQGLAKWFNVFINLLDNITLSFRKLHHTMLSQHCWNTHFPICHPPLGGKIWYILTFSLNFGNLQLAWWQIIFHYCFCLHFYITKYVWHFFLIFGNCPLFFWVIWISLYSCLLHNSLLLCCSYSFLILTLDSA